MTDDLAVRTEGLTKAYGKDTVLRDLNLHVPRGSIFAFLGPNGAGKTTTIKILMGLVNPTFGRVEVLGCDLRHSAAKARSRIGYVPEEPALYDYMTVEETHAFCRSFYSRWDAGRVSKVLRSLGLSPRQRAGHLSTGQKSALALALALGPRPELLILDEPTAGLDPVKRREYYSLMVDEVAGTGTTVLLATHLLGDAERLADRVAFINRGELVLTRDMDELKITEKRVRMVFQGEPPAGLDDLPGVRKVEREGRSIIFTVSENAGDVMDKLSRYPHFVLETLDMDLEDIFLAYVREGKPDG